MAEGMAETGAGTLFPMPEIERASGDLFPPPEARELEHATGILPSQLLRDAIDRTREVRALEPIAIRVPVSLRVRKPTN